MKAVIFTSDTHLLTRRFNSELQLLLANLGGKLR